MMKISMSKKYELLADLLYIFKTISWHLFLENYFQITDIAGLFGCSPRTIQRRIRALELSSKLTAVFQMTTWMNW